MARVEVTAAAVEDVRRLIVTHRLPSDTNERIRRSLRALERFPLLGTELTGGGWDGLRFLLGPWRWMVVVYEVYDDAERVVIVTVQDGRSSQSATSGR